MITDRTIHPDEHKSDIVYSTLKLLFDAVQVTVDDIYSRLKNKHIELSPKLMMQVQRERKIKQIKARIQMTMPKDRKSMRHITRKFSARQGLLDRGEKQDPTTALRNARVSIMKSIGEDITEEDYALLMEDEDSMMFFDETEEDKEELDSYERGKSDFQDLDIDNYMMRV